MNYRKDINGLRAIAVLLVLLFHGAVPGFSSGFIGVDVFFVISGFLITSIIQSDIQSGKFSLAGFYVRRLWRIQVALMLVVAVTLLIATAVYLPDDYNRYYKSAIQTVIAGSNRYFAHATTAYGATDSEVLLLLHTWSLSIEWQWYLVLPLALMALNKFASAHVARLTVPLLTVLLTGIAMVVSHRHGSSAYYEFVPRAFEFLFGATLAMLPRNLSAAPRASLAADMTGIASVCSLVVVACIPGVILGYPNGWTIAVCAASTLVLWVGTDVQSRTARLLSWSPLVFIGDISYSLYLWHWPIFATARYVGFHEGWLFKLSCYALTFACAWLSYRYVEVPYRKRKASLPFSLAWLVVAPLLVVAAGYGISHKFDFLPARFGAETSYIEHQLEQHEPPMRATCMKSRGTHGDDAERCLLDGEKPPATSLMIGDSYANPSWNVIVVLGKDAGIAIASLSTPSCLAIPGLSMEGWWKMNREQYQVCVNHIDEYYRLIDSHHYQYVILGENWFYYDLAAAITQPGDTRSLEQGEQRLEAGIRHALNRVVATGATPVIIKSPATMQPDFLTCFYRHLKLRQPKQEGACPLSRNHEAAAQWFDGLFARLQSSYPTLVVIDPQDAQCTGDACRTDLEGVPVYRDTGHLTGYASYRLGEMYLQRKGNPFKRVDAANALSR